MSITISGSIGSGKEITVGKVLAERLKYSLFDVGGLMREMLKEG